MTKYVEFIRPVLLGDGVIAPGVVHGIGYSLDVPWANSLGVMIQPAGAEHWNENCWRTLVPFANIAFVTWEGQPP